MHPSEIAKIKSDRRRLATYLAEVKATPWFQDSLAQRISCNVDLTEAQVQSGLALLGKGCRAETKARIMWALRACPKLLSHGIYQRVHIIGDELTYCAGQDYPAEIKIVRNLLIGKC